MTRILLLTFSVAALTVSILCGVLGVFSIAAGDPMLTVALALIAAATAWAAYTIPSLGRTSA